MSNFDEFWKAYPNRKGKGAAAKKYEKIDDETHKSILLAIEAQKRYRAAAAKTGEFMPEWCMPATWIFQQRWLDEIGSHSELKERVSRGTCSIPDCNAEVLGSRFHECEHHYQFDTDGRLKSSMRLVPELRNHYAQHPGIHNLRGKAAIEYVKNCIRGMLG